MLKETSGCGLWGICSNNFFYFLFFPLWEIVDVDLRFELWSSSKYQIYSNFLLPAIDHVEQCEKTEFSKFAEKLAQVEIGVALAEMGIHPGGDVELPRQKNWPGGNWSFSIITLFFFSKLITYESKSKS